MLNWWPTFSPVQKKGLSAYVKLVANSHLYKKGLSAYVKTDGQLLTCTKKGLSAYVKLVANFSPVHKRD